MKLLRLSLILLLAVLLPVRGALAAAMLCAPAPAPAAAHEAPHGHAHEHGAVAEEAPQHAGHDQGSQHAGHPACTHCAAFCSLTPLADTGQAALPDIALPAASFPPLAAQAVRFERDGPERPPRTV
ncbi:hypothetical protein [Pseudorhodoferax sp.]|uniref:hypothetical protein n=1 Tax=Pseudorhodoferax sp. TaxID=1993553 RepID=UPI002DD677CB|nr:hypothetical protein [Pseudorhodoferax sp.]